jgi:spermidine synthase
MKSSIRGIPFFYLPVVFFTAAAAGMAVMDLTHQLTAVFGVQPVSRVSIGAVFFFWLAVGSSFHGRWADRLKSPLVLAELLPALSGIYLLAGPWLIQTVIALFAKTNSALHPSSFSMGFVRLSFTALFLAIPLTSFGGLLPAVARFFTRSVILAGSRWSALVTVAALGLATGLAAAVRYMIPAFGYNGTLVAASLLCFLAASLSFLFRVRTSRMNPSLSLPDLSFRPRRVTMLFRKRNPVLEAGAKLSRAMMRVLLAHGIFIAVILLAADRLTSEFSTLPQPYHSMVITAVFLIAFAAGSFLYRLVSSGIANGFLLLASLEILSGAAVLFTMVLYPIAASAFAGQARGADFNNRLLYDALVASSLLFLPAFLSGMILPLAARSFPRRLQHLGRSLGRISAVFFSGILIGLILAPFLLFPLLGAYYTLLLLFPAGLFAGIYLLFRDSRLIRGFRLSYSTLSLLLMAAILTAMVKQGWIRKDAGIPAKQVIDKEEGSSAMVRILKSRENAKKLMINGIIVAGNAKDDMDMQEIPPLLAAICTGNAGNALVLGFGTGIGASVLEKCQVPSIHIAEIHPEVLTLAADAFSEDNNDILTSSKTGISIEDAGLHLARIPYRYDIITSGYPAVLSQPWYYTEAFFHTAGHALTEAGVFSLVVPLRGISQSGFWSVMSAATAVFPEVSLWYLDPAHLMLMATKKKLPPVCRLIGQFFSELHPTLHRWDPVASLPARLIMTDQDIRTRVAGYPPNSDSHPVIEFTRQPASAMDTVLLQEISENMVSEKDMKTVLGCPSNQEAFDISLHEKYREQLKHADHRQVPLP